MATRLTADCFCCDKETSNLSHQQSLPLGTLWGPRTILSSPPSTPILILRKVSRKRRDSVELTCICTVISIYSMRIYILLGIYSKKKVGEKQRTVPALLQLVVIWQSQEQFFQPAGKRAQRAKSTGRSRDPWRWLWNLPVCLHGFQQQPQTSFQFKMI